MSRNILQLVGSFHQGGSERQAVQLARLLHENGKHRIFVACLNGEGVLREEIERLKLGEIPEFRLSSFYDANFLRQTRNFARYLRENKIELVQTHDFYTNVFGMLGARLAGISARVAAKRETAGMRSKSQKIVEFQAFRVARKIVVNSEAVKNYLIKANVSESKISVIYNGLDLERLKVKENLARREILKSFDLPPEENKKFVTIVANLRHEVKNQEMFLRAAAFVKEKFSECDFVLAGEGERAAELKNLARDLKIENQTHFIGSCPRVPELLAVSDICVLSSRAEGFSNSILEYMAAGKPVVATDVGGAREAIEDGETGFVVASDNAEEMAASILFLLENSEKASKMGARGRAIIEQKFSMESQLDKTLQLYENLLD